MGEPRIVRWSVMRMMVLEFMAFGTLASLSQLWMNAMAILVVWTMIAKRYRIIITHSIIRTVAKDNSGHIGRAVSVRQRVSAIQQFIRNMIMAQIGAVPAAVIRFVFKMGQMSIRCINMLTRLVISIGSINS